MPTPTPDELRAAAFLVLAAGLLSACSTLTPPRPAPALRLTVQALDGGRARVALDPAPAAARWQVQPSQLCGGEDGPTTASGEWPAPALSLEVPARPGDLVTVWAEVDGVSLSAADCPT